MRRRAYLSGLAGGAASGLAGCAGRVPFGASSGAPEGPPRLSVADNWLVDPDGERAVLRGVNVVDPWWGTTYEDIRGKGYWETLELALDEDAGWYTDVLRVPIEPRSVRNAGLDALVEDYLDRVVELTRERGAYVILDYHAIGRYDTAEIDRRVRRFWDAVAGRYADETHVLYELFNEPTEPAGDGLESWRTWRETAQPWVDHVRERAPETPIIVGSPQWSSMTRFAPEAPFDGENLLYSAHVFPSWERDSWEANFGNPALDVPVFVTEWGYVDAEGERYEPHMIGTTGEWGEPFREWLDGHPNVGWTAWTFDSHWVPNMFDYDWTLLGGDDYMGEFVRRWLREANDADEEGAAPGEANRPPAAPTALRVTDAWPTQAELAWDPATDPDGDDVVQYRVAFDDREVIRRGSATAATLEDLSPGEAYAVSVTAVDGRGARSDPATVTVELPAVTDPIATIPRAEDAPTIDADVGDAWDGVPAHAIENTVLRTGGTVDLRASWRALWDPDALYVLVDVTDADAWTDSEEAWQDDTVEVYLDPDNSRATSYDGENDRQLIVRRGEEQVRPGANSVTDIEGIQVAQTETDDGYRVELAVPWGLQGVVPNAGHTLGMDVHVADDQDGGERDVKRTWFDTTDDAWQNPEALPIVRLGGR